MDNLTPDEARVRFGNLMHASTRTYREFEDGDGLWRPIYEDGELKGYRRYTIHKLTRPLPRWRPRRR